MNINNEIKPIMHKCIGCDGDNPAELNSKLYNSDSVLSFAAGALIAFDKTVDILIVKQ